MGEGNFSCGTFIHLASPRQIAHPMLIKPAFR